MNLLAAPTALRIERPRRRRARVRAAATAATCQPTVSAKRCGGPQDLALYSCCCGLAFRADVSTSVGCPECGTEQAW